MNSVFILLNSLNDWKPYCETDSLMTVTDYLEHRYGERTPKLVINLSDEYGYNSEGYYCSLLAQARGHRVLPGVETLNKLESGAGIRMNRNLQQLCQQWIERNRITDETWQLNIYFGTCREKGLEKIARFIFDHYPCPILRVTMNNHARNQIESVQALSLRQLSESGQDDFANALDCFNKKVWRSPRSAKPARYNLAILYDPDEKFPPSDKDALNKFLEVARKMNIHAELITEEEATRLMEFDALFIRATTALNHDTFRLAQRAGEPWNRDLMEVLKTFGETGKPMIGHCAAGMMFGFAGVAAGRRVAVHPMAKAAVTGPVATDAPFEIDGNFFTAQEEHAIPAMIGRVVEALK